MNRAAGGRTESGFTLIELVVVIVVLAILAATALPRFASMTTDARIAKMRAAEGAIKSGAAIFHAAWLAAGSPLSSSAADSSIANSPVFMEGQRIAFNKGYPDVGGDGGGNSLGALLVDLQNSGILAAAGGLTDYTPLTSGSDPTGSIVITPDAGHPNCAVTYTEPANPGDAPVIGSTGIDSTNGPINCL